MENKLTFVLGRIDSEHLAELWLFYREHFSADKDCLEFLYSIFLGEPTHEEKLRWYASIELHDERCFVPKRMINTVMRLVSSGRGIDVLQNNSDIFKVTYMVTCIEALQVLKGGTENISKSKLVRGFFENNISPQDKGIIIEKFKISRSDDRRKPAPQKTNYLNSGDITINEFAGVIYEFRNCATHQGDYWNLIFNPYKNSPPNPICINIDTINFGQKRKLNHLYKVLLTYNEFEDIFLRTCINFIKDFVDSNDEKGIV